MAANCNKLMLGAVLLLGFCLVGDALVPGLRPLHEDDRKVGTWWWLSGGSKSSGGPRKLLKPDGGVGAHLTTREEKRQMAATRQLADPHAVYIPEDPRYCSIPYDPRCTRTPISRRPCGSYTRCRELSPPTPPTPPRCQPYERCRRDPPEP